MITLYKQDGETLYGIKEYLLDSPEDLSKLPTDVRSGSSALILSTGQVYFLNGSKQWVAIGASNTSGGGGVSNDTLKDLDKDENGIIDVSDSIALLNF